MFSVFFWFFVLFFAVFDYSSLELSVPTCHCISLAASASGPGPAAAPPPQQHAPSAVCSIAVGTDGEDISDLILSLKSSSSAAASASTTNFVSFSSQSAEPVAVGAGASTFASPRPARPVRYSKSYTEDDMQKCALMVLQQHCSAEHAAAEYLKKTGVQVPASTIRSRFKSANLHETLSGTFIRMGPSSTTWIRDTFIKMELHDWILNCAHNLCPVTT